MLNTYRVSNKYKKSVEEVETVSDTKGRSVSIATLWRSGDFYITPVNEEEEIELLAEDLDDAYVFEVTGYIEWELDSTWDGCSEDYTFYGFTEEEEEALRERIDEEGWYDVLCVDGDFDTEDLKIFIHNGVIVELVEDTES